MLALSVAGSSAALSSVRLAVLLILETGFCVGAVVAFILNLILPFESAAIEVRWTHGVYAAASLAAVGAARTRYIESTKVPRMYDL